MQMRALATMTANPYVLFVATGTGGTGREAVRDLYANGLDVTRRTRYGPED